MEHNSGVTSSILGFSFACSRVAPQNDESERHLHFNWDFVIFVLLSYGTIGVLRGHLGHLLSSPLTSYHYYYLTALECVTSWLGLAFSRCDIVPSHVLSIYVQVHNSQWAMFSSQRLRLLPAPLIRRQLYNAWSRIEKVVFVLSRLTTMNLMGLLRRTK